MVFIKYCGNPASSCREIARKQNSDGQMNGRKMPKEYTPSLIPFTGEKS
jgi:hypothetical protein